jgi:hypothetical protein
MRGIAIWIELFPLGVAGWLIVHSRPLDFPMWEGIRTVTPVDQGHALHAVQSTLSRTNLANS